MFRHWFIMHYVLTECPLYSAAVTKLSGNHGEISRTINNNILPSFFLSNHPPIRFLLADFPHVKVGSGALSLSLKGDNDEREGRAERGSHWSAKKGRLAIAFRVKQKTERAARRKILKWLTKE